MTLPWMTLDQVDTPDGRLELRRRGEHDLLITIDGRILMNSVANRSELALGAAAAQVLEGIQAPRVLVSGLGMGYTLAALLANLPGDAVVEVVELNPVVVDWCRRLIGDASNNALADPRVRVIMEDVTRVVREELSAGGRYHGLVLDLYDGPMQATQARDKHIYGAEPIDRYLALLEPGGVLAVWGEKPDKPFINRLKRAGFSVRWDRPGRGGGFKHVVYLAQKAGEVKAERGGVDENQGIENH